MSDDTRSTDALNGFALDVVSDFTLASVLESLVERTVTLPSVGCAGATLLESGGAERRTVSSSSQARLLQRLQVSLGEGPSLLASETGGCVSFEDLLAGDQRFPVFGPAAASQVAGARAIHTFPIPGPDGTLGILDLYAHRPGGLRHGEAAIAQTLADVAGACLTIAAAHHRASEGLEQMRELSTHDQLTGLPNRALLLDRLEQADRRARRSGRGAVVLFIDLDRFKDVNDAHGHQVGDELLKEVGSRLGGVVRPGDTLARVYGDEFVLLCEDLERPEDTLDLLGRVRAVFLDPFTVEAGSCATQLPISASVGAAFAGPGQRISHELLNRADQSMYDAKRRHADSEPLPSRSTSGRSRVGAAAHRPLPY